MSGIGRSSDIVEVEHHYIEKGEGRRYEDLFFLELNGELTRIPHEIDKDKTENQRIRELQGCASIHDLHFKRFGKRLATHAVYEYGYASEVLRGSSSSSSSFCNGSTTNSTSKDFITTKNESSVNGIPSSPLGTLYPLSTKNFLRQKKFEKAVLSSILLR